MGSLRDQFKKARLLSDKDAKRLAHEERIDRKEKGRDGLEQERAEREAELARRREEDRGRDRQRQAAIDAERQVAAERAACEAILGTEVRPVSRGNMPWHFELPDGRLPMLRLNEVERHQLQGGQVCLVRRRGAEAHVYGLLATAHARRVARHFPERIVWSAPVAPGA
jgi:uncharacterized protein YaiL (DUF2058 family)